MSDSYRVDAPAMTAVATKLDDATEEVRAATALADQGAGGDLGPGGITAAVGVLTGELAARLRAVDTTAAAGATGVRAARDAYLDADDEAAAEFRGGD